MAKGITKAQKTKIWTKAHEIGITKEQLRDLVKWISGQESTRKITKRQGILLIDLMEGKTSSPPPDHLQRELTLRPRKGEKRIGRFLPSASSRQIGLIEELKIEAGYDDEHLKNHIRKYQKVDSILALDVKQAGKVIDVLKKQKQKRVNEDNHVLS